jgi:hypothetical protein
LFATTNTSDGHHTEVTSETPVVLHLAAKRFSTARNASPSTARPLNAERIVDRVQAKTVSETGKRGCGRCQDKYRVASRLILAILHPAGRDEVKPDSSVGL